MKVPKLLAQVLNIAKRQACGGFHQSTWSIAIVSLLTSMTAH
jgi:hypothetical protein